jgi:hypothetical protein
MKIELEKFYFSGEVAEIFRCTKKTAQKKMKEMNAIKDGRLRVAGKEILAYIKKYKYHQ